MAKTREQKKEIIKNLKDKLAKSKSVVFASFEGLGVIENEELRKKLKEEKSEYYVAKKTLLDLALKDEKIDGVDAKSFQGKVATVFGYEDEVAPAKIIDTFRKDHEDKIDLLGGILEGRLINSEEVKALAKLPSRLELYAKLVGSLSAPMSGLMNVLTGSTRKLVYVLNAIAEKKK